MWMPEKAVRHRRPRSQEIGATADQKLQRHLRTLGLESADAYRAWCRRLGFSDALRKSWQEERQERQAAQAEAEATAEEAELLEHARALGLATLDEYAAWCRAHDLSAATRKTRQQRQQERRLADRERGRSALAEARRHSRRPGETIQAIERGQVARDELRSRALERIFDLFAALGPVAPAREALLRLLLHVEARAKLLATEPVFRHLGNEPGNSYLEALATLAGHHRDWLRPVEEWRPDSHSPRRQFGSLARHLLGRYPVPAFMDAAWFVGNRVEAAHQQGWFRHIGVGQNIRTAAGVPFPLTKRMAHHFLEAPDDSPIEAALRWGQVLGMGGEEPLVRAVVATRLGEEFEHEAFWATVLQFFVNNPMLDTACVGPIVDYVHHQKFVPREIVGPDGQALPAEPPQPEFSMKGRTVPALLARVEVWHAQLAREARQPGDRWAPSGIAGFHRVEGDAKSGNVLSWSIREVLTRQELITEGKALNHCVRSYARSCLKGTISIWSLQMEDCQQSAGRHVMTIAVQNKGRVINQARGKANALPGSTKGGDRLRRAGAIMRQWAEQEGLSIARHI
jgi:hypothetical protein